MLAPHSPKLYHAQYNFGGRMAFEIACIVCGKLFPRERPDQNSKKCCSVLCRWSKYVRVPADVNACWYWTGTIAKNGYGVLRVDGKLKNAHRLSLSLHGEDVTNKSVLHSCDNRACVNPLHLRIGTDADNVKDTMDRKRHATFRWTESEKQAWLNKIQKGLKRYRSQKRSV